MVIFQDIVDKLEKMEELFSEIKQEIYKMQGDTELPRHNKSLSDLFVDKSTLKLKFINNNSRLTNIEFQILTKLLDSKDMFCSFEELCKTVYNCEVDSYIKDNIRIHMYRLRKKIGNVFEIENIKSRGYKIVEVKDYGKEYFKRL